MTGEKQPPLPKLIKKLDRLKGEERQLMEELIYRRQMCASHTVTGLEYKPKYDTGEVIDDDNK